VFKPQATILLSAYYSKWYFKEIKPIQFAVQSVNKDTLSALKKTEGGVIEGFGLKAV